MQRDAIVYDQARIINVTEDWDPIDSHFSESNKSNAEIRSEPAIPSLVVENEPHNEGNIPKERGNHTFSDASTTHLASSPNKGGRTMVTTQKTEGFEKPKPVYSHAKRYKTIHFAIHIVPIAISLFILGLYHMRVFWEAPGPNTDILALLQVAAKAHEALILFSLSSIVLQHIRSEMFSERGVYLGLLGAVYQLNSPAYHFSYEFLSCLKPPKSLLSRHMITLVLLLLSFVLSMISGPSSAILMLPRLKPWAVKPSEMSGRYSPITSRGFYIASQPESLYPTSIFGTIPALCLEYPNYAYCPTSSLVSMVEALNSLDFLPGLTNISLADDRRTLSMTWKNTARQKSSDNLFITTTQSAPIARYIIWKMGLEGIDLGFQHKKQLTLQIETASQKGLVQQPLTFVQCGSSDIFFNHTLVFGFRTGLRSKFSLKLKTHQIRNLMKKHPVSFTTNKVENSNTTEPRLSWVDLRSHIRDPPTLSFMVWNDKGNTSTAALCLIDSFWIESRVSYVPRDLGLIQSSIPESAFNPIGKLNSTDPSLRRIRVGLDWVTSLNVPFNDLGFRKQNVTSLYYAFQAMQDGIGADSLARFLGPYITNAIALHSYSVSDAFAWSDLPMRSLAGQENVNDLKYVDSDPPLTLNWNLEGKDDGASWYTNVRNMTMSEIESDPSYIKLESRLLRNVYGYGFEKDDILIYMATSVLLIHSIIALLYLIKVIGLNGWTTFCWSGIGEIIALAANSQPSSHLKGTSAGVDCPETWRLIACVRAAATESDSHLELLIRQDGSEADVELGHPNQKRLERPKADQMYF